MNILEIVSGYMPYFKAGVPKHIAYLIDKLGAVGGCFCLVAQDIDSGMQNGVKCFRMPSYPLERIKRFRNWKFIWFDKVLRYFGPRICKDEKIDIIHGHTWPYGGRQAIHLGMRCKIPVVLTLHGTVLDQYTEREPPLFAKELMSSAHIIVQKPSAMDKLVNWGFPAERITLQLGPALMSEFAHIRTPEDARSPKLLFASRFDPIKNPRLLPELAKEFKLRGLRCKITAAGDGPLLSAVKADAVRLGVADWLHFPGWLDNVRSLHADHSMYLALSTCHNVSDLSLLDAMCDGLVPLAVKSADIDYLVKNKENGFVCDPCAAAIADAVEYSMSHCDIFSTISRRASETASMMAGEKIFINSHIKAFENAMQHK